jgi:hypothetical protein
LRWQEKIIEKEGLAMKANEKIREKTDLHDVFLENRRKGVGNLGGYPVDISAIYAFGIKAHELKPYESNPEYANIHWSVILEEILAKREEKE